ncbi:MAG: pilus assembly protein [Beijerinckiaceae bacterium]|nr:pilus assembly protein [Beijerinckiaceae bacterium]
MRRACRACGFWRRIRGCDSGATAVEFAIVVWPLLLVTLGLVEVGRLLWTRSVIEESVTLAARCASVRHPSCATPAGALDAVKTVNFARDLAWSRRLEMPSTIVTVNTTANCAGAAGFGEIVVNYEFNSMFGSALGLSAGVMNIRAGACFPMST